MPHHDKARQCRSCYLKSVRVEGPREGRSFRNGHPVLLVEQLVAWTMYRRGEWVIDIGNRLGRTPAQARRILHGEA